jgi:hypothetical protein
MIPMPLPFAEEAGEDALRDDEFQAPDKIVPRFRITLNRLIAHGVTQVAKDVRCWQLTSLALTPKDARRDSQNYLARPR